MKILIVGAGLAGMAAYHALDKTKFDIDIVEKREALDNIGYALILNSVGVKALRLLGYSDKAIKDLGTSVDGCSVFDKDGTFISNTDFKPFHQKFDDYKVVSRSMLYSLLTSNFNPTSLKLNIHPVTFKENDSRVIVTFSDNTQKEYDLVIGADGVHSSVREHIYPETIIEDTGLMFLIAWLPRDKINVISPMCVVDNKTDGLIFCDSSETSRVCLYFYKVISREESKKFIPADYQNLWKEAFKDFTAIPGVLEHLPPPEDMYKTQDKQFSLDVMYKGPLVLIGDAGHVKSIFGGSGSSAALEDAIVLGNYLNTEESIATSLKKYSESQNKRGRNIVLPNLSGTKLGETFNEYLSTSPLFKK
jgi:2-polyprenyl-6-methoxyphenol hydroxylase-like FAD-dependent oxidoreductase